MVSLQKGISKLHPSYLQTIQPFFQLIPIPIYSFPSAQPSNPSPKRQGLAAATLGNANQVMSVAQNGPALRLATNPDFLREN